MESIEVFSILVHLLTSERRGRLERPSDGEGLGGGEKSIHEKTKNDYFSPYGGILAETKLFVGNDQITNPFTYGADYGWTKVELNRWYFDDASISPFNIKRATIAHEMGHVYGLWHDENWGPDIIMYPYMDLVTVVGPTEDEIEGINILYPL